jgi:hypothetical protein
MVLPKSQQDTQYSPLVRDKAEKIDDTERRKAEKRAVKLKMKLALGKILTNK